MKSGTSSLYQYLNLHPEILMSSKKETDFFIEEKNFDKGFNWYKSLFDLNSEIVGEASPNYTKRHLFEGVPSRIFDANPDIKLIYLVRDPYERIISHYIHNYSNGRESDAFFKAIQTERNYILTSRYYYQLEPYISKFKEKNILVVKAEKLFNETDEVLGKVFKFLNVDDTFSHPDFSKKHRSRKTKQKRRSLYKRYIKRYERYLQKIIPINLEPILPNFLTKEQEFEFPTLDSTTEDFLYEELQKDFQLLKGYTGLSFKDWSIS